MLATHRAEAGGSQVHGKPGQLIELDVEVYSCNPSSLGVEAEESESQSQLGYMRTYVLKNQKLSFLQEVYCQTYINAQPFIFAALQKTYLVKYSPSYFVGCCLLDLSPALLSDCFSGRL